MPAGCTKIKFIAWDWTSREEYDAWKLLLKPEGVWDLDEIFSYLK
jgi:hypothetical protein